MTELIDQKTIFFLNLAIPLLKLLSGNEHLERQKLNGAQVKDSVGVKSFFLIIYSSIPDNRAPERNGRDLFSAWKNL